MSIRVLTFVSGYVPGFKSGGPVQSIANVVDQLGDQFSFQVVTRDRDSGDAAAYAGVVPGRWTSVGRARVCYLGPSQQKLRAVARLMRETPHDVIYINSFFNRRFSIYPLLAMRLGLAPRRPVIVAPRGELSDGAMALKPHKKRLFLALMRLLRLHRHVLWQTSSKHEEREVLQLFGATARVHIAGNLSRAVSSKVAHPPRESKSPLRVLFLSRISPKKNITFLIDALSKVSVPVNCSVIGFIDTPEYWKKCLSKIRKLPSHVLIHYDGAIPACQVPFAMAQSDLLFLPTLGENFGHVIMEALAAGTPVLISDQTPWQDLEETGAGWAFPLDALDPYVAVIDRLYAEDSVMTAKRRSAAATYAKKFMESDSLLQANRELFERAHMGQFR